MKVSGKIFNVVLSLWAIAILWICVGTLVNFHQHKIWGKPLLPELLYAKRDKEKYIDLAKLIKPDIPKKINPWSPGFFSGLSDSYSNEIFGSSSEIVSYYDDEELLSDRFFLSTGLRAPPVS
jgi:hypothetical protein